jgi:predicted MPP superfamily phosphohydrolase
LKRALALAAFAAAALGVLVAAHVYVAKRLVLEAGLSGGLAEGLLGGIVLLGLSLLLQPVGERTLPPRLARWIAWPAALWMGLLFYLLVGLALSDLLLGLSGAVAVAAPVGAGEAIGALGPARAALVAAVALSVAGLALRGGLAPPTLRRVEIRLPRWPRALDSLRIAQVSDLHIGPILGARFARRVVERVNALQPDLVAVTGDLVDGSARRLAGEVAPFAELRAPLGVYFVTGNHDYYSGARAWVEEVQRLGMRALRNERVTLGEGEARFLLAGVDDHHGHLVSGDSGEDLDRALEGAEAGLPIVLLAHDPTTFKRASRLGVDLQLSGHTHGGQIWPFGWLVRLAVPFVAGLYRRGGAALYVSRGTGFWGPPMRLGAPAEITELVLRASPPEVGARRGEAERRRAPARLRT